MEIHGLNKEKKEKDKEKERRQPIQTNKAMVSPLA